MLRWIGADTRQRLKPPAFDVAVALVFVAVAQTDVWLPWGDGTPGVDGPQWASSVLMLAATAPLAWRRRAPLRVAVTVMAALVIEAQMSDSAQFLGGLVPAAIAAYTVAAYGSLARATLGFAILCTGVLVVTLSVPELRSVGEAAFPLALLVAVWAFGRLVVHRLRTNAHALTRRAEALERRRDHEARAAVDLERARIARELHDVIAHSVSLMGIQAAAAEQVLALDPERAREPLQAIQSTAREAIDELRRLLGVLRDGDAAVALRPQPGLAALDALVEQMRGAGLPVELRVEGDVSELSPGVELSAYRVVQEALTNVLKHAGAGHATVVVRRRPDALELEIADDGGHEGNGDGTGHGLIGMRERVALYGGTLASGRRSGGGYGVRASLPTHPGRA